jgi:hypothetical protein
MIHAPPLILSAMKDLCYGCVRVHGKEVAGKNRANVIASRWAASRLVSGRHIGHSLGAMLTLFA